MLLIILSSLLQMDGAVGVPSPFFLFLHTWEEEAVKKQYTSGFLLTTLYQWPATAFFVLPVSSATATKQRLRF